MKYLINDDLENAGQHTATIARLKYQGLERGLLPEAENDTATVTFIKCDGRTYAVTASHVIQAFDNCAKNDGRPFEGYFCPQDPGVVILGPFLTPPANYPDQEPDIAICPVCGELPDRIGKTPFEILSQDDAQWPVTHALAVGFPTVEKREIDDEAGRNRLALSCVYAVAEGLNSTGRSDQVQFHSELSTKPSVVSLSGMSGGPVFWSDGTNRGLIGFVKEALDVTTKEGEQSLHTEPKINFICQRVDYAIIKNWLQYIDANWQKERDKINNELRQSMDGSR